MITKLTTENAALYRELFEEANKFLTELSPEGGPSSYNINDIEGYFQYLQYLINGDGEKPGDLKFSMLPIDEETFDIDANSRTIKVPENYKKYGLAVQGDDSAEIIWFEIDRYYDIMDFNNTTPCIQWKHSKDSQTHYSWTWYTDIRKPNKLIFGWPIDKEITEKSGNIEFSIRFLKFGDDGLTYNFNTLPVVLTIQPSLNITTIVEGGNNIVNKKIRDRITNSVSTDISLPLQPIFITKERSGFNPDDLTSFLSLDSNYHTPYRQINLGKAGSQKIIKTMAFSTVPTIDYKWEYKNNIDSSWITQTNNNSGINTQSILIPVQQKADEKYYVTDVDKNLICYSDESKTNRIYFKNPINEDFIEEKEVEIDGTKNKEIKYYLKAYADYAFYNLTTPGLYRVIAENNLENKNTLADNLYSTKSEIIEVPHPKAVQIGQFMVGGLSVSGKIFKPIEASEEIKINSTVMLPSEGADCQYDWLKKNITSGQFNSIGNETEKDFTVKSTTDLGTYKLKVTNKYNNGSIDSVSDSEFIITSSPLESSKLDLIDEDNYKELQLIIDIGAKEALEQKFYADKVKIDWFKGTTEKYDSEYWSTYETQEINLNTEDYENKEYITTAENVKLKLKFKSDINIKNQYTMARAIIFADKEYVYYTDPISST